MVCKLDTGANCCVISKEDVLSLPRKTREACRATLTSFFGHKTTAQFKVKLSLSVNDKQHDETFFVIEQNVPVTLSGAAAESLGLIYRVDSVETQQLYPEAQPFTDVFTGLGQLKNFEYEMKLKPGAVGVVVPARRVPVAIEEKVKAELQRMEEHNVITKRLMGRQTRTLLPVPSCHLKPAPLPSRKVHSRLQEIRHKQKVYYNRGARDLRALSPGQRASLYDTHTRTWSPVVVLGSAGAPRSVLVKQKMAEKCDAHGNISGRFQSYHAPTLPQLLPQACQARDPFQSRHYHGEALGNVASLVGTPCQSDLYCPKEGRCNRVGTAAIASASCRSYVSVTSPAWPT
ncbi:uncharacterized protein LOC119377894 isoform X2 [Rhipicephalus sanguineus]|uniref:uncharacterized protein LOC119377894 isoform X2 n=1 Tax=Rhipicephalus sanguineus TaxID=34632 RepID=UPI0020C27991|nr:uncharacterized protein LOC119377894 isoform X2 [Rhipicephalus sanguineus]